MLFDARHRAGARDPGREPTSMSQRAQRMIEAARKLPVPEGTYAVGLGLIISGVTAYGFQILAFRGLSKTDYAALNGLWILLFIVAPGFFLPLEQEVGRAVARPARQQAGWRSRHQEGGVGERRAHRRADHLHAPVGARVPARGAPVPRADGVARLLPHRARDLRRAVPGEGRVLGQRPLRPLRRDPRQRGHHPDDPAHRRSSRSASTTCSGTGSRSRCRRSSPSVSHCAASTGSCRPGPTPSGRSSRPTSPTCSSGR